jgi:hypothetical protein
MLLESSLDQISTGEGRGIHLLSVFIIIDHPGSRLLGLLLVHASLRDDLFVSDGMSNLYKGEA